MMYVGETVIVHQYFLKFILPISRIIDILEADTHNGLKTRSVSVYEYFK